MSTPDSEHKTRTTIINHILAHPGVSFSIIKGIYGLADGTLRYHLNYLESKHEIRSTYDGKSKRYYPVQNIIFDNRPGSNINFRRLNDTQEKLMVAIQRYPGITQKELIIRTHMKRLTIGNNIKKLVDFGVIRKEPNGRNICYYYISSEELKKKVIKRLIDKLLNYEIDEKTFLVLKHKLEQ